MKTNIAKNAKAGFSLVEMLVVIAVIGVIAAIAVPTIGNITRSAKESTDKRNAQNLCSVYSAAVAAGASEFETFSDEDTIAGQLASGVYGSAETGFDTTLFKTGDIADLDDALDHVADADFSYDPQ